MNTEPTNPTTGAIRRSAVRLLVLGILLFIGSLAAWPIAVFEPLQMLALCSATSPLYDPLYCMWPTMLRNLHEAAFLMSLLCFWLSASKFAEVRDRTVDL